jgi:peptidoglycan/xylan/chitin deacetylase (PgdA/CDA1 family)
VFTLAGTGREILMSAFSMRLFAAAIALGVTGAFTVLPAAAATAPPPGSEGPAGPPALMPNGKVAAPPQVTAPQVSTSCPAAQYGAKSAAPGSGKTVALTFDDGPGASTASILSILGSYGIPATFFNIGQNMAARPTLVRQEASMGYVLDNHTWDHPNMTTLPASAQGTEMDQATAEQVSLTGVQPCGFRPPGGNYNSTTLSQAQQRRMTFWTWSVDTEDWKANGSSSSYWVNRIISLAEKGGSQAHPVVLMHNQPAGNPATVLALRTIIQYFGSHGYTFVDLLGRTAARTPGNLGDEVNPSGNGFDVFHRQQAVNAVIVGWTATKADPATHFIRLPGTVPGAYRFEYAPNGVATGLSVADPGYDAAGTGLKDGLVLRASNTGLWQQFIPQPNGTLKNAATGLYVNPNGTAAQLRGGTAPSPWGGSVYTWTDYAHLPR